jgi:hypothetical protein
MFSVVHFTDYTNRYNNHNGQSYKLTIAAEDRGNPQQSTRDDLWINIKFVNITAVTGVKEPGAGQNIIIAIVIGCITACLPEY